MKFRFGFVTNSSSNQYIVKNITDSTKTMLDLLREAADNDTFGPWQAMPECYLGYDSEEFLDEDDFEEHPSDRPLDHATDPKFLEAVAKVASFPPNQPVKVSFEWANVEGMILLKGETESFEIEDITTTW